VTVSRRDPPLIDPDLGVDDMAQADRVIRVAVVEETVQRVRAESIRRGAVGLCGNCGRYVLARHMDATGRHTAILTYGRNRVVCNGVVITFGVRAPREEP
jgi:hypothetical protein